MGCLEIPIDRVLGLAEGEAGPGSTGSKAARRLSQRCFGMRDQLQRAQQLIAPNDPSAKGSFSAVPLTKETPEARCSPAAWQS